jgi:hypothetical protein
VRQDLEADWARERLDQVLRQIVNELVHGDVSDSA